MDQMTLRQGTTGNTLRILLGVEDGSGGQSALEADADGLRVAYIRDGDDCPTPVRLTKWTAEGHQPGGLRAVDARLMPGLYEIGLPDELTAVGAHRATLMIQGPGIGVRVVYFDLVAYDPYDSYRLGLDCLSREARHEVISRAFREVVPDIVEEFRREG